MSRQQVLTLILAGGKGSRLGVLTKERAKPVMPFAGTLRLIDFALSNCMHSNLRDVWVIEQHELHSLNEHLSNGRPWDLDRTYGGLQVLPPYTAGTSDANENEEGGFAAGNADAIYRHRRLIRDFQPDVLLVLSADHVYKLDYNEVLRAHTERKAEVTIVTKDIAVEEASRFGTVMVGEENRITEFEYKPEKPQTGTVTTEVFVYDGASLLRTLDELAENKQKQKNANDESSSLKDFGHELLPRLVQQGRAFAHRFDGYWRDLGTIESYWEAHMDLLANTSELNIGDSSWIIRTFNPQQLPAQIHDTARITNSLISPGCAVHGKVERSILASGVKVEENAVVRDSIVLANSIIGRGAVVDFAIIDTEVSVGGRAQIGARLHASANTKIKTENLTIIGQRARISENAKVEPGEQVEPNTEV